MASKLFASDGTLRCSRCREFKPPAEFNPDATKVTGRRSQCNDCRRLTRKAKGQGRCRGCGVERPKFSKYCDPCAVARIGGHPRLRARRLAEKAVYFAVKNGTLKRGACVRCGSRNRVEFHHHNGYDRENRLNVVCLCSACHREEHRRVAV